MIPELQELAERAERMCDAADEAAGRRHTTFGLLRVELCLFLAHLCKADFHLADEEVAFIADNLDIPFTTEEMNAFICTHNTENPDFANTIPTSFSRLVDYDRAQAAESSPLSPRSFGEVGSAAALYIELFKAFGEALISVDSVRTPYELSALADYLAALAAYRASVTESEA